MQDNARKLTYGAMMIAIFMILSVISLYVPVLGAVIMVFTPLPIILYRLRYDRTASIFVVVTGMVISLIGGILLVLVTFTFGLLGLVIGDTLQTKKTKLYTFMAAGLTFLITTIILYVLWIVLFGINIIEKLTEMTYASQKLTLTYLESVGDVPDVLVEQLNNTIQQMLMAIPTAFILSTFGYAFIVLLINLPIVKRLGHDVPKFPSFRLMKLPVLTVWVYMLVILMPLFLTIEPGSTTELSYVNGTFMLRVLFLLQGISFIFHIMHEMKSQKWLTILLTVVAIMLSPLTVILGILDTGLNIRAWVGKNKSR